MPFDDVAKQFVKPDVFSLEGLAAWLETQPASEVYCYSSVGDCLLHRYFSSCGLPVWIVNPERWFSKTSDGLSATHSYSQLLNDIAVGRPHTYAAALDRCRTLLAEGQQ